MEVICSKANATVKQVKKLLQRKYRTSSYLIEGWHLLEEAEKSGAQILQIFVLEDQVDRLNDLQKVKVVSKEILNYLTDSKSPQGVLAEVALPNDSLPVEYKGRYLILEDVQDPGNVGTMIRTADAAGFDGVFMSNRSADLYSLKVVRSMQGSQFHLPVYRVDLEVLLKQMKEQHLPLFATTLSDQSVDYRQLSVGNQFALIMGNEGQGISETVATLADQLVHIPMPGQAESLNVAVATGILLFHFI
ncbi:TrmH family RNA methyltransferase [Streptococcus sp. DD13]|uniref:TrmH family RNA methyltransferase n=1 Tax=Streptococcus sp. DD13 TaxID=1777881 RepID=UPI00079140F5|nr:RNA methyltransferase [Streptococcus sp. DD13]KXT78194.1 rRNA methylase [Streptococcus sp. DD13]